jgi:glucose-6-phosphate 1-dehydrogenase
MTTTPVTTRTTTLCILGASGDLTSRLLLPGLGSLLARDTQRSVRVVGSDARPVDEQTWRETVVKAFTDAGVADGSQAYHAATEATWDTTDVTSPEAVKALLAGLGTDPLVLYFALPPAIAAKAVDVLKQVGVPEGTQLALEKPFGGNAEGAIALNATLLSMVPETSIHRVDHFLGVSTVLNVISLRFANRLFQPVWNADDIAAIEIVYDEPLTLEGRAGYYDKAGAMIDMIQSHLLQVMALVTMEPPARIGPIELRDMTTQALRATQPWGGDPAMSSHRAQYTAGTIGDRQVPDYTAEPGVDPARQTETLAQVTLEIHNERWSGVPITLRSGKSIGNPRKAIILTFRDVRHVPHGLSGHDTADQLVLHLSPDQLELRLTTNTADDSLGLKQSTLVADLQQSVLKPYAEVLAGILDGDPTLTVRGDAAEECWRIVSGYQKAWAEGKVPMETYAAGSDGPAGWEPAKA